MKKFFGLAMLPVMLATVPAMALADQYSSTHSPTVYQAYQRSLWSTVGQVPVALNGTDMRINQKWLEAQQSLITRHYPEAVEAYQNILFAQPNSIPALHGLANALYSQGRYTDALQAINKAVALDPVNSQLYFTKAQILDSQDKPQEAIEAYLTFSAMAPEDTSAFSAQRRANELYKLEEPKLGQAWQNYLEGLQMLSLRQPQRAIALFEKYQTIEPNNFQANMLLGQAYMELNRPEKAVSYFESAVKLQSDNPVAYYRLGASYQMKGEPQNATNAFRKFLQFAPQSQSAMLINQRIGTPHTQLR
jgi:tetratricopeptide (TPR) repeat protein